MTDRLLPRPQSIDDIKKRWTDRGPDGCEWAKVCYDDVMQLFSALDAEKARADLAEADMRLNKTSFEAALSTERAARERAEAALAEVCPEDYVCASDGWGPCDEKPKWCDEHRLNAADKRDHTVAEAAREWANFVKLNPSRWENKSDRILLAAIAAAP